MLDSSKFHAIIRPLIIELLDGCRSWIVVMAALGTVDMLLNLINFIQMSDPRLQYGLVIGESSS